MSDNDSEKKGLSTLTAAEREQLRSGKDAPKASVATEPGSAHTAEEIERIRAEARGSKNPSCL